MLKVLVKELPFLILFTLLGCGAVPGNPDPDLTPAPKHPEAAYHYVDAIGSSYDLTWQKLIYTPASEDDTVDGVEDAGYYTELNITPNDYTKLAAAFEQQLERKQEPTAALDLALPVPKLSRNGGGKDALAIDLDAKAVRALNYVLDPYLNDQH